MSKIYHKGWMIDKQQNFDRHIKVESEKKKTPEAEKTNASLLNNLGRVSSLAEGLYNITLEEQNLPVVGEFEDITKTQSFIEGRKRGKFFLDNDSFTIEHYEKFLKELTEKHPDIKFILDMYENILQEKSNQRKHR